MKLLACALLLTARSGLAVDGVDSTRAAAALALVEGAAKAAGPDASASRARIQAERAELERAFSWFVGAGRGGDAGRFIAAIHPFLPSLEARDWFARVLAMASVRNDPQVRMPLLVTGSSVAFHVGDQARARRWADELLAVARSAGDRPRMATAYFRLSQVELRERNLSGFHRINGQMLAFCRETRDEAAERCEANVRNMRGEAARVEQDYTLAAALNERNLAYGRERDRPVTVRTATLNLAFIDLARGATAGVRERLLDGIASAWASGGRSIQDIPPAERESLAVLVAAMGMLAERERDPQRAAHLLGVAAAELDRLRRLPDPADQEQISLCTARVRKALGRTAFERAFAAGRRQAMDEAVASLLRR